MHVQRSAHLARGRAYKNGCRVYFGEILDLSPFSTSSSDLVSTTAPHVAFVNRGDPNGKSVQQVEPRKDLYRLSSIVVHYGTHSYGHYVTYRRTPRSSSASAVPDPTAPTIAQLLSNKMSFADTGKVDPFITSPASSSDTSSSDLSASPSSSSSSDDPDSKDPFITVTSSRSNGIPPPLPSSPYHDNVKSDWYRISDETVDKTDIDTVLKSNPFLLFYEKIRDDTVDIQALLVGKDGSPGGTREGIMALPRVVERWSAVVREEQGSEGVARA